MKLPAKMKVNLTRLIQIVESLLVIETAFKIFKF